MTYADTMNPLGRLNPPGDYRELATQSVLDVLPGIVGWINDAVRWVTRQFGHEINVVQWLSRPSAATGAICCPCETAGTTCLGHQQTSGPTSCVA